MAGQEGEILVCNGEGSIRVGLYYWPLRFSNLVFTGELCTKKLGTYSGENKVIF